MNVAEHVLFPSQELVAVKVTVLVPPHLSGAPVLLLVMATLHPPEDVTVANQVVNFPSMAA